MFVMTFVQHCLYPRPTAERDNAPFVGKLMAERALFDRPWENKLLFYRSVNQKILRIIELK
jgi:hypothetical protein